jgi:hypothetical protein
MSIKSYLNCRSCNEAGRSWHWDIGFIDPQTLRLQCATCDRFADFELAEALPIPLKCECCGEDTSAGHSH